MSTSTKTKTKEFKYHFNTFSFTQHSFSWSSLFNYCFYLFQPKIFLNCSFIFFFIVFVYDNNLAAVTENRQLVC